MSHLDGSSMLVADVCCLRTVQMSKPSVSSGHFIFGLSVRVCHVRQTLFALPPFCDRVEVKTCEVSARLQGAAKMNSLSPHRSRPMNNSR